MAQQTEFQDFEVAVDMQDVDPWDGSSYKLPPPGDYMLVVVGLERKNSQSSQQPMIAVTFEIIDEGEAKGLKVFQNYSLSEKARGRLKQFSLACGAQLDKFVANQHYGVTIRGTVIHTEGAPTIGPDGTPRPARTFANVCNEMPLEGEEEAVEEAPPPPVTKATKPASNKATTNGAARRA